MADRDRVRSRQLWQCFRTMDLVQIGENTECQACVDAAMFGRQRFGRPAGHAHVDGAAQDGIHSDLLDVCIICDAARFWFGFWVCGARDGHRAMARFD